MNHDWICQECGPKYGRVIEGHVATYHNGDPDDLMDSCGWCGSKKALTQPRDYGHPQHPGFHSKSEMKRIVIQKQKK